tara:strand:- start:698 stop:1030 length:333 start_codon:yes stop_codon:yes gene_type:complete
LLRLKLNLEKSIEGGVSMSRFNHIINKEPSINSTYSTNLKNTNVENVENVEPIKNVVFFGGYEGSDVQLPYTYAELEHLFKDGATASAIRFIHEAKKYGDFKFIKQIKDY